jgi:chromosome segregation ATPase
MTSQTVAVPANRATLDALKAKRARLVDQLAKTKQEQTEAHARVAVAVAADETTPDDWHQTSSRFETTARALDLGITQTDEEIRKHRNACNLAVARIEQGRVVPTQRALDTLLVERTESLRAALDSVVHHGRDTAPEFPATITRLEQEIASARAEIASAQNEIAALKAE